MTASPVLYFTREEPGQLQCQLCPHHCRLKEGQTGLCRVRVQQEGKLLALNYGEVSSLALDPIEKKPLYHFYPGSMILSAGTWGCNFACPFCQNYSIAQQKPSTRYFAPEELLKICVAYREKRSIGLAFTYNEPVMWHEYIMDLAPLLQAEGLKVVLVSNGYIESQPLKDLLPFVDAMNIDVKAFNDRFYQRFCHARLDKVKETVEAAIAQAHIEITTLLIPGENDVEEEISALAKWLAGLNPDTVLHLSRYFPAYQMNLPPTPVNTLKRAREIAREHLNHVYLGNVPEA